MKSLEKIREAITELAMEFYNWDREEAEGHVVISGNCVIVSEDLFPKEDEYANFEEVWNKFIEEFEAVTGTEWSDWDYGIDFGGGYYRFCFPADGKE